MNGRELARALGAPEQRIYKWAKKGWLNPTRHDAGRWTGEEMVFNLHEQNVARIMVELVRCGMYPDGAAKIARGSGAALDRLLKALSAAPQVWELRYRLMGDTAPGPRVLAKGPSQPSARQQGEDLLF